MSALNRTQPPHVSPCVAPRLDGRRAADFAALVQRVVMREGERDPESGLTPADAASEALYRRAERARVEVLSPHFRSAPRALPGARRGGAPFPGRPSLPPRRAARRGTP